MSTFRTAAQRRADAEAKAKAEAEARGEEVAEPRRIAWPDTETGPFHFAIPGASQLGLFGTRLRGRSSPIEAVLRLCEVLLPADEFEELMKQMDRGDLELEDFLVGDPNDEVRGGLIGLLSAEATGRPTQPSSGSSPQESSTGIPSTGRVPSEVSTPSTSQPTDS